MRVGEKRLMLLLLLLLMSIFFMAANVEAAPLDDLIDAVNKNDSARVKELVAAKVDVNATDAKGTLPLIRAAVQGNPEIAKMLLDAGAKPNLGNKFGWTPIFVAVARMKPGTRHGELVDMLLSRGADPKQKTEDGTTLLMQAVTFNHSGLAQRLLKLGLSVKDVTKNGETVLHMLPRGATPLLREFIDAGADINARSKDGTTPLFVAILRNDYDSVKLLLDRGVAVDQPSVSETSPLTAACGLPAIMGPEEKVSKEEINAITERIVHLLVERGADVNAVTPAKAENDMGGFTPLHSAAVSGPVEVVRFLIAKGAKVNQPIRTHKESKSYQEADGVTPLMMAALAGRQEVVELLLAKGADINARATNNYNAAMFAIMTDQPKMVEYLNAKGLVLTDADRKRGFYDRAVEDKKRLESYLGSVHTALCSAVAKDSSLAGAPMAQLLAKAGYKEPIADFTFVRVSCSSTGCEVVMRPDKMLPELCKPVSGLKGCESKISGDPKKRDSLLPELVSP